MFVGSFDVAIIAPVAGSQIVVNSTLLLSIGGLAKLLYSN